MGFKLLICGSTPLNSLQCPLLKLSNFYHLFLDYIFDLFEYVINKDAIACSNIIRYPRIFDPQSQFVRLFECVLKID
jgi:hypothetical protein